MPLAPENGFIENIQNINTTGGAQIAFRCNESFVPVGRMSATCTPSNGSWTPDPADLICNGERFSSIFVDYGGYIYIYILQDTEVDVIVLWINTSHFHLS